MLRPPSQPRARGPRAWPLVVLLAIAGLQVPVVSASDHNEPSPGPVWPAESALHKEWDLSDLFAWYDRETDNLNIIVAWHPQQLPLSVGEGATFNDQVLFQLHLRDDSFFGDHTEVIDFRYGRHTVTGDWGMLIRGLPGMEPLVLDCAPDSAAALYHFDGESHDPTDRPGEGVISVSTGVWDDPFVFDIDGFNASLSRALEGEVGLRFDPQNDTFEGHNITAVVLAIPMSAIEEHWPRFDVDDDIKIWATTTITEAEAAAEEGR